MEGSDPSSCIDEVSFKIKETFQWNCDRCRSQTTWTLLSSCIYKSTIIFLPNRSNRFELLLVDVGCIYLILLAREICMFVDKDQSTRRSELFVGACYLLLDIDVAVSVRQRSLS